MRLRTPFIVDEDNLPLNCRFEIDDVNLGLSHFAGRFDLVHARLISTGIKDFRNSIVEMENCLRPGGMIIWVDIDFDMYANGFSYRAFATDENPSGSWFQRFAYGIFIPYVLDTSADLQSRDETTGRKGGKRHL